MIDMHTIWRLYQRNGPFVSLFDKHEGRQMPNEYDRMSDAQMSPAHVSSKAATCQWCGLSHQAKCSLVKSIEYFDSLPEGQVRRIEFFEPKCVEVGTEGKSRC